MSEQIILVDEHDNQIGTEEKLKAHQQGLLHRAFSIYIFNDNNELMLQQRAADKYHCGGLWTNTTCGHPRDGENMEDAVHRRLQEEMGFDTDLEKVTEFIYKVPFENGLTEHEYLHVYLGRYNAEPKLNTEEAQAWKWISLDDLETAIETDRDSYTYWMKKTLLFIRKHLKLT